MIPSARVRVRVRVPPPRKSKTKEPAFPPASSPTPEALQPIAPGWPRNEASIPARVNGVSPIFSTFACRPHEPLVLFRPIRGSPQVVNLNPRLTPWAIVCRCSAPSRSPRGSPRSYSYSYSARRAVLVLEPQPHLAPIAPSTSRSTSSSTTTPQLQRKTSAPLRLCGKPSPKILPQKFPLPSPAPPRDTPPHVPRPSTPWKLACPRLPGACGESPRTRVVPGSAGIA